MQYFETFSGKAATDRQADQILHGIPHFQLTVLSNYCVGHSSLPGLKQTYRRLPIRIVAEILIYLTASRCT
jgi:hypothetical protein